MMAVFLPIAILMKTAYNQKLFLKQSKTQLVLYIDVEFDIHLLAIIRNYLQDYYLETMASASSSSVKGKLPASTVQSIILNTNQVPDNYIQKNTNCLPTEPLPWMEDLIIDFSLLSSCNSSLEAHEELKKLYSALTSWGCFQIVNHGMTSSFLDEIREAMRQFYAFPLEEKQKYSRGVDGYDGYGNDSIINPDQVLDWNDRLFLSVYPEARRQLKYWPEKPENFREMIHDYTMKHKEMVEVILKAMARALNLEEDQILNKHGEQGVLMSARFNFYPNCSAPERVLGTKVHTDRSTVTFLLQDDRVDGLHVFKDDQWFKAPVTPDAIFVNAGDLIEIMSNGIFKSAVHRVVANSERERLSLVMFCFPSNDTEIEPFKELICSDRPQSYKKFY
ncbi:hypothetical protein V2J09_009600 [Rumex salicifolius]